MGGKRKRSTGSSTPTSAATSSRGSSRATTPGVHNEQIPRIAEDVLNASLGDLPGPLPELGLPRPGNSPFLKIQCPSLMTYVQSHRDIYNNIDASNIDGFLMNASNLEIISPDLKLSWPTISAELEGFLVKHQEQKSFIDNAKESLEKMALTKFGFDIRKKTLRETHLSRRRSSVDLLPNPFLKILSPPTNQLPLKLGQAPISTGLSTLKIRRTESGQFKVTSILPSVTQPSTINSPVTAPVIKLSSASSGYTNSKASSSSKKMSKPPPKLREKPPTGSQKSIAAAKPSVPNQINSTIFWNYVETFFKGISEQDLHWLDPESCMQLSGGATKAEEKAAALTQDLAQYFIIPPLGSAIQYFQSNPSSMKEDLPHFQSDTPGSLTSRLLSSLIDEKLIHPLSSEGDNKTDDNAVVPASSLFTYRKCWYEIEARIRQELLDLGLLEESIHEKAPRKYLYEDDEICASLRQLQAKLKLQNALNKRRKRQLFEHLVFKANIISTLEYNLVLEEIYKKLEVLYQQKKKGGSSAAALFGGGTSAGGMNTLAPKKKKKSLSALSKKVQAMSSNMSPIPGGISQENVSSFMSLEELCMDLLSKKDLLKKEFSAIIPYRYELLPDTPAECIYHLPTALTPSSNFKRELEVNGEKLFENLKFDTEEERLWVEREKSKLFFPIVEDENIYDLPGLSSMVEMPLTPTMSHLPPAPVSLPYPSGTGTLSAKLSIGKKKIKLVTKRQ